jgi:hypothetical protein
MGCRPVAMVIMHVHEYEIRIQFTPKRQILMSSLYDSHDFFGNYLV